MAPHSERWRRFSGDAGSPQPTWQKGCRCDTPMATSYTLWQKTATFLFFKYLCQQLTDFNDFWCVKSWENLTSVACTFAHLTCILLPLYLEKSKSHFSTVLFIHTGTSDYLHYLTHHTTILRPFFWDHPGEPVPEENLWALWCKGNLTEADTLTIRLGATPSRLTSAHLHHPPIFFTGRMPFLPPNQQCQSTEGN